MSSNNAHAGIADPLRPVFYIEAGGIRQYYPDFDSVVHGVIGHDELRRALILKLLISYGDEIAQIGGAFADRVAGYLGGTLRPWAKDIAECVQPRGIRYDR